MEERPKPPTWPDYDVPSSPDLEWTPTNQDAPIADGGTNDPSNLVLCCQSCNSRKRDRPAHVLQNYVPDGVFWFEHEGRQ